jgi:lipoprotein-anchoring transpeptidase ErfK/SrfK
VLGIALSLWELVMRKLFAVLLSSVLAFSLVVDIADARHTYKHKKYQEYKKQKRHSKSHFKKKRKPALPPIVVANVDVSSQTMTVKVNGWYYGTWKVSTGRKGYNTPRGTFRVGRMARVYYSKKYDNSPMPYSLFFSGGNAVHGTNHLSQLGRPASHGCIRLAPQNAAKLYALAEEYGGARTRINIEE